MTDTANNRGIAAPHILAVDDEAISREILKKMLEHLGYHVDIACNGQEALALWQQSQHAMVITDCQMPGMNGFELSQSLRKIEAKTHSPKCTIIALTANEGESEHKRCLEAGMNLILSKPIRANQLKSVLNSSTIKQSIGSNSQQNKKNIIDYNTLSEVFPDKSRQYLMLSALQQHLQVAVIELYQHLDSNNIDSITSVAHRLKGACKMVGVNQVAASFGELEKQAEIGCLPKPALLSELQKQIDQFNKFMAHEFKDSTSQQNTSSNNKVKGGE